MKTCCLQGKAEAVQEYDTFNTFTQKEDHLNGSVQDCSISIANTLELLQACIKPSIWWIILHMKHAELL